MAISNTGAGLSSDVSRVIDAAKGPDAIASGPTTYNVSTYAELIAALGIALDSDVINLAAGTYTGDVAITRNVTINGANTGVAGTAARGAESVLAGQVTANAGVSINGVQFLNTSDNSTTFNALTISGSLDATVTNSVFFSTGPNGNNDRAITMDTSATGVVTISNNYFTGAANGQFSTASWSRAIWSDGAATILSVSNNTFEYVRTGLNLDGYNNAATNIGNNQFVNSGTGISVGTPVTTTISGIHDNVFTNVATDFNLRNVTTAQSFDLAATNNAGGGTGAAAQLYVLGGAGGDTLTGSAGNDILDARDFTGGASFTDTAANTLNGGGGDDILIGSRGNDTLNGGMGADTAVIVPNGGVDTFDGGAGTDTLDLRNVGAVTATASGATTTYSYTGGSVAATSVENLLYTGSLTVSGVGTDDTITTGDGNETINGNDGNDTLTAGAGNDQVFGGNGNDTIIAGSGAGDDFYDGGAGTDTLVYSSTTLGIFVDMNEIDRSGNAQVAAVLTAASLPTTTPVGLATGPEIGTDAFRNIENVTGGSGNDLIFGNAGANVIVGGAGSDFVSGGGGNDTLDGEDGFDTLDYQTNGTNVQVNLLTGQVNAGAGNLDAVSNFEIAILSAFDDQFIGDAELNLVEGGAGNDQLDGRGGTDYALYNGSIAADGVATQVFGTLQFNAGVNGTDQLTNIEIVRFQNGADLLDVVIDNGNAVVASRDDAAAMTEGDTSVMQAAATGALSNDINLDQGGADQKVVAAVNGSAGNVGVAVVGTYGTLTLNADGSYTYVQNQAAANALSGGEIATDTFTYTADDGDTGNSVAANLVFTITGVNDAPVTGGTQAGSVTEDAGAGQVATGTLTVTDVDDGEAAYLPQTTNNEEGFGTFALLADGTWTYTLDNASLEVQQLGAGQSVTETFIAETIDGTEVPVTITINGTNDNPAVTNVTFTPFPGPVPGFFTDTAGSENSSFASAFVIDGNFSLATDGNIGNSTTVPHVTINGATNGGGALETDFYRFTVGAASTVVFDIDNTTGYANTFFTSGDTRLRLFNSAFTQIATNDDAAVDAGSTSGGNSFLSFAITAPGTYYISVAAFDAATTGGTYQLHVSLPGGTIGTGAPLPGDVLTETNASLSTSGTVTFTDVDLNDTPVAAYNVLTGFAYTVANGPMLTAQQEASLASAFSISPSGAFNFSLASPDVLGHDDVLTLTYSVTVSDQHGGSTTTPVVITINGSNDRPVITSVAQGATLAETNAALTASGAVTATDADNGDVLTYSGVFTTGTVTSGVTLTTTQVNALVGAFAVNSSGAWTYNLASPDFLPAGSQVNLTFTVTANDGHGGTTPQTVLIVINGTNDAPTITAGTGDGYGPNLTETDAALTAAGKVNFTDIDINSAPTTTYAAATDATVTATGLTLSAAQIDAIKAGFVLVDAAGNYTFNLASPDYLAAGDVVTATFNVHVIDGQGGDTIQPIIVTITGTNDGPVLTGASLGSIADTEAPDTFAPLTGSIAGAATDIDNHDTKTFTLNGSAESAFGTLTLETDGSYSFAVNNAAVNGLLTGDTRTVTYSVTVTDSGGLTSTADFTISITGQNEDPVFAISPLAFFTADFGGTIQFDLLTGASDPDNVEVNDLDITNVEISALSVDPTLTSGQLSLINAAIEASFSTPNFDPESGVLTFDTSAFDFLDENQDITVSISYTVTDSNGGSAEQTATVTISGILENNEEAQGTPFDDYLEGGRFGDIIFGEDGDDEVYAADGADVVIAGGGDDYVDGASGADTIYGGSGDDEIVGGSGNDTLYGDEPRLFGGEGGFEAGDNRISGGSGNDAIYGGLGNNVIAAGSGNDDIYIGSAGFFFGGEGGWDVEEPAKAAFDGGEGGLELDLPSGMNIVDGGSGFDTVHVSGSWSDYTITRTGANSFAFERMNEDGTLESNSYTNVEYFVFAGGEGTAAELANDAPVVNDQTIAAPEVVDGTMVPEGGVFIGNVQATDPDEALGDTLRYFLDGVGAENFSIDENGDIYLVTALDFETDPTTYTLLVRVADARGLSDVATITVNITDADDPISATSVTGAQSVAELAAAGTVVATAAAMDPDAGSIITYALSDDAGGRFAIDATTGVITVANGNLLDFEQAATHNVTVVSTSGDSTSSATVAIAVTDVSPEAIVGTGAAEMFVAGAGGDSYATNITLGGADRVNLGMGLDRVTVDATSPTTVLLRFTSGEVGNGNVNDSNTLANQDGGLAVRMSDANNVEGAVTRLDDEGMVFIAGAGVTFNVTDLPTGVSRGNLFEVAILGTSADDTLNAVQNTRPYYFNAGGGNDVVNGGTANDFLVGGAGNDILTGNAGNNSYIGGAGIDTISFANATSGVTVFMFEGTNDANGFGGSDTYTTIENVTGGAFNDLILGDANVNVIMGGGGSDYLAGLGGDDTLDGGAGDPNTLQGGTGNDTYIVNNISDSLIEFAGEGIDTARTALTEYTLRENVENLVFTNALASTGVGNDGDNSLTGGSGNDTLTGGAGEDLFVAIATNGLDTLTDFVSGTDAIGFDASYSFTSTIDFVSGAGAQTATSTNSTFLYDTTSGILSYDADGTGTGAAVALFNLGAGTALVSSDLNFPIVG